MTAILVDLAITAARRAYYARLLADEELPPAARVDALCQFTRAFDRETMLLAVLNTGGVK